MKKRIINGQYSFPKQKKTEISQNGKSMIKRMLDVNSKTRISIDEILNSEWLNVRNMNSSLYIEKYH
jgi:hypothetical protein